MECGDQLEAMWDVLFRAQAPPSGAQGTEKVSFTLLPLAPWVKTSVGAESGLELFRGSVTQVGSVLGEGRSFEAKEGSPCPSKRPGERWTR